MTRAIIMAFHKYTPFGDEFYEPMLDFQLNTLEKYKDEFERLYLIDSNWGIKEVPEWIEIIKVSPHLRYYDAYKEVLPQIKEDLILFMDNDMIVYNKWIIKSAFLKLEENNIESYPEYVFSINKKKRNFDIVSIYALIGEYKTDKLNGKNKFCPFWFATKKELLMKYLDVDWGPDMPYCETLGHLTEAMLKDDVKPYEWKEDYSSLFFDRTEWVDGQKGKGKNLGYYHIRAGSTPAYLLAAKHYGHEKTYWEYLKTQAISDILRRCAWYKYMGGDPSEIIKDLKIEEWKKYLKEFNDYHRLEV